MVQDLGSQNSGPCLHVHVATFPVFRFCVFSPSKDTSLLDLGPNLIQYNLILTNYICKEPISKSSHILRF